MTNTNFQTQEGSTQNIRFLNVKDHTPPETKANQTKRQTQQKTLTPPQTKPYRSQAQTTRRDSKPNPFQPSMSNPWIKPTPLNQHNKSKLM
jgi:hypothetical protein